MDFAYGNVLFGRFTIGLLIGIALGAIFDNVGVGIASCIIINVFISKKFHQKFRHDAENAPSERGDNDNKHNS